jgi:hypothetical protein
MNPLFPNCNELRFFKLHTLISSSNTQEFNPSISSVEVLEYPAAVEPRISFFKLTALPSLIYHGWKREISPISFNTDAP